MNVDPAQSGTFIQLVFLGATPYVAWCEATATVHQIYVKHWTATGWVQDGGSLNLNSLQDASYPSLAVANGVPYVAWTDFNAGDSGVYVKHWNGSVWEQVGGQLNMQADRTAVAPCIAIYQGTPYVSWDESNLQANQIYVKYWNGSGWISLGGSLNVDVQQNAYDSRLVFFNGVAYASWHERKDTKNQVYVKHWTGSRWVQDGGSLNINPSRNAFSPSLACSNDAVYVAWVEEGDTAFQIYVKHWSGSGWVQNGGSLNINPANNPFNPSLAISNGTPYVAWIEDSGTSSQVYVKYWTGSSWRQVGEGLSSQGQEPVVTPSLAMQDTTAYVAFGALVQSASQVVVKHWVPVRISRIEPNYALAGTVAPIKLFGPDLTAAPQVKLIRSGSPDISSSQAMQNNAYSYTYTFDLSQAAPGGYDVQVTSADGPVWVKQALTLFSPGPSPARWTVLDLGAASSLTLTTQSGGLDIADVDQDGAYELYVASLEPAIHRLKKFSYGWTVAALSTFLDDPIGRVVIADGDGDQAWEIYGCSAGGHVYQLEAIGTKSDLGGQVTLGMNSLTAADLDHDGVVEIYAGGSNGAVWQFKKNGLLWARAAIPGTPVSMVHFLAAGDGNRDGAIELYSANADQKIYQYQYTGHGWQISTVAASGGAIYGVTVGDGDNDQQNELYAANQDGQIYRYRWEETSWSAQVIGSAGGQAMHSVVVSDGDNDGKNEVYAACGDGHVYAYAKSAQWITHDLGNAHTPLTAITVGDADNDHYLDIYALGQNNHVYQFHSLAPLTPTPPDAAALQRFFKIYHNQINPTRGELAVIRWTQPRTGPVSLVIYNLLGEKVTTLLDHQVYPQGHGHEMFWDGRNSRGEVIGSGIYIVWLKSDDLTYQGKIAVVK